MRHPLFLTVSTLLYLGLPSGLATNGWAQESFRQSPPQPQTVQDSIAQEASDAKPSDRLEKEAGTDTAVATVSQTTDELEKLRRRVVHLRNGMMLRDLARFENDQWWIGPRKKARPIDARFVERVCEEKALLKTFKKKNKASRGPSAELAGWAFGEGLLKEGLRELDQALRSHQQRAGALQVLRDYARYLPKPPAYQPSDAAQATWERQWLWLQTRQTPAMESLAAQVWAQAAKLNEVSRTPGEVDPWMQSLTDATVKGSPAQREFALHALREWRGERSAPDLQRFALLDASERVRLQAGWLLGTLNNPQHVMPIIDLVEHKNEEVQVRASQALGQAGYAAAVPALVASLQSGGSANRVPHAHIFVGKQTAYVQDFAPEVAQRSAIADPIVNVLPSGVVLDVGVRSITIERHLIQVRRSLHQITGHRPGASAKSWNKWLEKYSGVDAGWRAPWPTPEQHAVESATLTR